MGLWKRRTDRGGESRDPRSEEESARIDADLPNPGEIGTLENEERLYAHVGEHETSHECGRGNQSALGHPLAEEGSSSRAERRSNGHLAGPPECANQEETGDVRDSDGQKKRHGAEHEDGGAAGVPDDALEERHHHHLHGAVLVGLLRRQVLVKRLKLCERALRRGARRQPSNEIALAPPVTRPFRMHGHDRNPRPVRSEQIERLWHHSDHLKRGSAPEEETDRLPHDVRIRAEVARPGPLAQYQGW